MFNVLTEIKKIKPSHGTLSQQTHASARHGWLAKSKFKTHFRSENNSAGWPQSDQRVSEHVSTVLKPNIEKYWPPLVKFYLTPSFKFEKPTASLGSVAPNPNRP